MSKNAKDTDNLTAPYVPKEWPGAFGMYKHSKKAINTNLSSAVFLLLISFFFSGTISFIAKNATVDLVGNIIDWFVQGFVLGASAFAFTAGVKGIRVEIADTLRAGGKYFFNMLGLYILVSLSLIGSFLLFVIPFFFVAPRLLLANYYLVNEGMGVMEAYKASWNQTKGHSDKVWGIIGVSLLMALLMITIIGIPFAVYFLLMYSAATAVLYSYIKKNPAK
jgi:hypothetical protein